MQVLAIGLAAAGGSALLVASCLDRSEAQRSLSEPSYVETTSANVAPVATAPSNTDSSSGPAAPVIVQAAPPVNVTINNELPAGTTTTTSADEQVAPPVAGHASHAANDPNQNPNLQAAQVPLVSGGIVPAAPLVQGGNQPNYTPAPYGSSYAAPPGTQGSQPGDTTINSNPGNNQGQGGGAGNLGSGGGATQQPAPAPTSQFTTDWGPWGSGYTTPNPNMGAGEFSGGNGPKY